tara:strand:- start:12177 stop:13364 length:1188 start_codon:yes stop_codon:yes gene_type:complete
MSYIGKSKLTQPVINYTHPNHSGHVTSSGDGATTIANNVITNAMITDDTIAEAKLDISNTGSNGQYLEYQNGGLQWSTVQSGSVINLYDENLTGGPYNTYTAPQVGSSQPRSVAIGHDSTVQTGNGYSFAIGDQCGIHGGEGHFAVGKSGNAAGNWGTGISNQSKSSLYGARSNGNMHFSFGAYGHTDKAWGVAMGYQARSDHQAAYVFGNQINSFQNYSVSLGNTSAVVKVAETYTLPTGTGSNGQQITSDGSGGSSWGSASSDLRVKKNFGTTTIGLEFIEKLEPLTFEYKSYKEIDNNDQELAHYKPDLRCETEDDLPNSLKTRKGVRTGLIAQDVEKALEELGIDNFQGFSKDKWGVREIHEDAFVFPLINAIKELSAKVRELEDQIKGNS